MEENSENPLELEEKLYSIDEFGAIIRNKFGGDNNISNTMLGEIFLAKFPMYSCKIKKGTKAFSAYRRKTISERHRHRWEVNNRFRDRLTKKGLVISGENSDLNLVEIVEIKDHPWYVAGQFHPELKSRVSKAHPLFREFVNASVKNLNKKKN